MNYELLRATLYSCYTVVIQLLYNCYTVGCLRRQTPLEGQGALSAHDSPPLEGCPQGGVVGVPRLHDANG